MDWLSGNTRKSISILLGALVWAVGCMMYADYTCFPAIPGIREAVAVLSALAGAIPGMIWYEEFYLGNARCIIIGTAIGVIAILNRQGVLIPFICGVFTIEMMSVLFRHLYYRQVKKKGKQSINALWMYRFQTRRLTVMIFPPAYRIRDAKNVIRLWLVQFILSAIVHTLVKT